jgi:AcrR family transcriptional regulator
MKREIKSKGGRPRSFDREQAIGTAMRLFWKYGYEGVGLSDLTDAIGITAPSLYAAFGNKAQLFREALQRYSQSPIFLEFLKFIPGGTLKATVRRMLVFTVRAATDPRGEGGCMILGGMIAAHPEHRELVRELADRRSQMRDAIRAGVQPWVGEKRAPSLARYLVAVMQGIAIQARDGASADELLTIVDEAVDRLPNTKATSAKWRQTSAGTSGEHLTREFGRFRGA